MEQENKNKTIKSVKQTGFISPIITPDNYVFGSKQVPEVVLQENGDWSDYLPSEEVQFNYSFDTFNCTAFATTNAIEILMFRLFGKRVNYSDRFLGIMAGTKPPGNDPHTVAEAVRKYGLIPEELLPFSDDIKTVEDYFSFKGGDKEVCLKAGQDWLAKYDFKHEWALMEGATDSEEILSNVLKFSPLSIGVNAWQTDNYGQYIRVGQDNHLTTEYAISTINRVASGYIFDSYQPFKKILGHNYGINVAKRFHISERKTQKDNWFIDLLKRLFLLK